MPDMREDIEAEEDEDEEDVLLCDTCGEALLDLIEEERGICRDCEYFWGNFDEGGESGE